MVEEAAENPEVFAGKSIGQIADHFETIIRGLNQSTLTRCALVERDDSATPTRRESPLGTDRRRPAAPASPDEARQRRFVRSAAA